MSLHMIPQLALNGWEICPGNIPYMKKQGGGGEEWHG